VVQIEPARDVVVREPDTTAKDIKLRFVPVVDAEPGDEPVWITLLAFVSVTPVGYVTWSNVDGEIDLIWVEEPLRRCGVASALWTQARQLAAERGWVEPRMSSDRSEDGDALARAVVDADELSPAADCPPWAAMREEYYFWRRQRWQSSGWAGSES
jgi:GNAT superfamily N-acetyltransferase